MALRAPLPFTSRHPYLVQKLSSVCTTRRSMSCSYRYRKLHLCLLECLKGSAIPLYLKLILMSTIIHPSFRGLCFFGQPVHARYHTEVTLLQNSTACTKLIFTKIRVCYWHNAWLPWHLGLNFPFDNCFLKSLDLSEMSAHIDQSFFRYIAENVRVWSQTLVRYWISAILKMSRYFGGVFRFHHSIKVDQWTPCNCQEAFHNAQLVVLHARPLFYFVVGYMVL